MKNFLGLGKIKDKLNSQRFLFTITIHNLAPWPESGRAVAIGWQRGQKHRGATKSVFASTQPGKIGTVCRFNEKFELSSTLYKSNNGTPNKDKLGPFKKKCLILAVLETDGRTHATAALGRVVIDLAEFAAIDRQETRMFVVTCNKQIHNAVGEPQMLITIRTREKRASATANGEKGDDDAMSEASGSSAGSRMTDNLASFLKFHYTGQGPASANEEQDLRGWDDKLRVSNKQIDPSKLMNTIEESHDDDDGVDESPMGMNRGNRSQTSMQRSGPLYGSGGPPHPYNEGPGRGGRLPGTGSMGPPGAAFMSTSSGRSMQPVASGGSAGYPGAPADRYGGLERYSGTNGATYSPRSTAEDPMLNNGNPPSFTNQNRAGLAPTSSGMLSNDPAVQNELVLTAAADMTVHLARPLAVATRRPDRAAHASARRIARTMVCVGPQQAAEFGRYVLRLINAQLEVSASDLHALAFWWANLAHLRALLSVTREVPQSALDAILPQVNRMEKAAFDSVVSYLWEGVLLPALQDSTARPAISAAAKRAQQEGAVKRLLDALKQVSNRLIRLQGRSGGPAARQQGLVSSHLNILRLQAMMVCHKRLDALLFHHLVTPANGNAPDLMSDYDPSCSVWGAPNAPAPVLDDSALPFQRGLLTFGAGMNLKMYVQRLQQWAANEGGLSEAALGSGAQAVAMGLSSGGAGAGTSGLFPLLKGVSDLLMMPKDMLLDPNMRRDVSQALSIRSIIHILSSFQPDEYAMDPIKPEVLASLQDDERVLRAVQPTLTDLATTYRPPHDEVLLSKVHANIEPGVEFDGESEDELVLCSSLASTQNTMTRFKLLHDLWYGGARYKGPASVGSSSRGLGLQI